MAGIEQQATGEVGLFFELLEVIAIVFTKDLPVDVSQVVTWDVFSMLSELDRESVIRTSVQTGNKALDDQPSLQVQSVQSRQRLRIEVIRRVIHGQLKLP